MLNKLAKLALVSTALAPICLTLWFVEISSVWQRDVPWAENLATHWLVGSGYLLAALALGSLCFGLVWLSASRYGLERLPVKIKSVKTVDKEIVGFLPLSRRRLCHCTPDQTKVRYQLQTIPVSG